jgi:D-arabinose 1-dehydrogenase-like Zn-dependent alcohol dehydrogenase
LVAGHEIVGKILEKGSNVHKFKVGDIVGAGWRRNCCKKCKACSTGNNNLCQEADDDNNTPFPKFGGKFYLLISRICE